MQRPTPVPQSLLVSPNHANRVRILKREIIASIRPGSREFFPGGLVYLDCPLVPFCVQATIDEVGYFGRLGAVYDDDIARAGYGTKEEMLASLRVHYPRLTFEDEATVVTWKDIKGFFVDHAEEYERDPAGLYARLIELTALPPAQT